MTTEDLFPESTPQPISRLEAARRAYDMAMKSEKEDDEGNPTGELRTAIDKATFDLCVIESEELNKRAQC